MQITFRGGPIDGATREVPAADGTGGAAPGTLAMILPAHIAPDDVAMMERYGRILATTDPPRSCPHRTAVYCNAGVPGVWEYILD